MLRNHASCSLLILPFLFTAVACGGSYQGSLRGNLSTPNYPQNYPDGSKCIWIIHCPYQHVVSVSLPSISIEEDKTCAFDYLVFYDGSSVRAKELSPQGNAAVGSKVCGRQSNLKWKSTGASITAQFHSDDSTSEKGFSGTWACTAVPGKIYFSCFHLGSSCCAMLLL